MCGIVGYVGGRDAAPLILEQLKKLEYRGYDSAGVAIACADGTLDVKKARGRLSELCALTHDGADIKGTAGIGHTRWATHGEPSDINSHPHLSMSGRVALVHNGIIENYAELKAFLISKGYKFVSDTDTEVIVQLVDNFYNGDPITAVRETVALLRGSFALGIVFADRPDMVIGVRKDSPLIVGVGENESFIASDVPAILKYTRRVIRLLEYELAVITRDGVTIYDRFGKLIKKEEEIITWDAASAEKGGHAHFMLKEILEQPDVIKNTVNPRVKDGRISLELKNISDDFLKNVDRIFILACGSAYHVGALGKCLIEKRCRIPVTLELASEFRYLDPMVSKNSLAIVISQSGETLDTIFAQREAKERGAKTLSVVNVVGSTIAAESDDAIYTWAGPEIAVATTKAYSAQLAVMYLISLYIGGLTGRVDKNDMAAALDELERLPALTQKTLELKSRIQYLASLYMNAHDIFFIGRNIDHALALEGSLKLKEISYIHSEAYAAGELKHGTISLIEEGTLVVAMLCYAPLAEKMISNIREVKARGARVLAVCMEGDDAMTQRIRDVSDHVLVLPKGATFTSPSLSIIPLQLFAYYTALLRGCDIDKPRNLAKSVTVE